MLRFCGLRRLNHLGIRLAAIAGVCLFTSGCLRASRAPITPPHWMGPPSAGDPFLNSPQGEPTPVPAEAAPLPDDNPQPTFGEEFLAPTPVETERVPTPLELPPLESFESDGYINPNIEPPRLEAPTIVPQAVTVPPTLGMQISAPEENLVGEVTVFEVTLENSGDETAENVVVECRFEEGLQFPGSTDRQVNQTIGTLAAGESRDVKLSLKSDRAGYHCVEFSLVADDTKPITKKVCVQYRDSAVSLEVYGPAKRMVDGHAEWNLAVTTREDLPVSDAAVVLDYDSTYLKPVGGSEGARQELGRITWPLGMLQVSERVELQVEFECLMPVDSTCLKFQLQADGKSQQTTESCIAIERRIGALELDLRDVTDPVQVGDELEYEITVTNRDLRAVHDLQITGAMPDMFRAMSFEVREAGQPLSGIDAAVEGSLVKFDPVDVLAPDATLTFRIKAKALSAGTGRLLLSVSSDDGLSGKIRLEEVSTVVE